VVVCPSARAGDDFVSVEAPGSVYMASHPRKQILLCENHKSEVTLLFEKKKQKKKREVACR
jgi:hypothetical protein